MCFAQPARDFLRRSLCAACRDEFFLYEKMGRRAIVSAGSTSEVGGRAKAPVPTPTPKNTGIQGDASPWQELEGGALEVFSLPA